MEDDNYDDALNEYFAYRRNYYAKMIKNISTTSPYTFSKPRPQTFPFPSDVISRIFFQKQSPYLLLKLYQTCKHFFKKFQVLPTITACYCSQKVVYNYDFFTEYNFNKKVLFWICDEIILHRTCFTILQRIYCCSNLKVLKLSQIILSYETFLQIIQNSIIKEFRFDLSNIVDKNGKTVPLNIILHNLPYCTNFIYLNKDENFTKETFAALNQLKFKKKFDIFHLDLVKVTDNFDITDAELFWQFVNDNIDSSTSVASVSLIFMKSNNSVKIESILRAAFQTVSQTWKGPLPKIGSPSVD